MNKQELKATLTEHMHIAEESTTRIELRESSTLQIVVDGDNALTVVRAYHISPYTAGLLNRAYVKKS